MRVEGIFLFLFILLVLFGAVFAVIVFSEGTTKSSPSYCVPQVVTVKQEDLTRVQVLNDRVQELQAQNSLLQQSLQKTESLYDNCPQPSVVSFHSYETELFDLTVVVRDEDGDRVEDARVRLENADEETEYTDEDGEAFFSRLQEDCYNIRVSKSGYETENTRKCIEDDEKITIRLER